MTEAEAKGLLSDCMRVLYYRDARTINKVIPSQLLMSHLTLFYFHGVVVRLCVVLVLLQFQLSTVTDAGAAISEPFSLETMWSYKLFQKPSPSE